VLVVKQI